MGLYIIPQQTGTNQLFRTSHTHTHTQTPFSLFKTICHGELLFTLRTRFHIAKTRLHWTRPHYQYCLSDRLHWPANRRPSRRFEHVYQCVSFSPLRRVDCSGACRDFDPYDVAAGFGQIDIFREAAHGTCHVLVQWALTASNPQRQ